VGFLKGDSGDDAQITNALQTLRQRLVKEITPVHIAGVPKMLWKTTSLYQCLMRRTIEAADGMRSAWNAGNLLTTITMARSLIEIGAIVDHLTESVKKATESRDVEALDKAVMNVGFGTKFEVFEEQKPEFQALNVLTVIDRMDKRWFRDRKPRFRSTYDFLSEFVHPNHYGILGLYSDDFPKEYRIEFGNVAKKRTMILPTLRVTLSMVRAVDIAAREIGELIPAIIDFVPK
jgi:hypothetical protein